MEFIQLYCAHIYSRLPCFAETTPGSNYDYENENEHDYDYDYEKEKEKECKRDEHT